eukprot:TRINITY_DN120824_c0_g1_i1.p1 TRINITY_DN120824_c0_g1~~TRINITY_DN120824_c0_g1_i1.p1  ORF type:complete len:1510 (-),score=379.03 TRINITY_DN120824_c0_g1_i1:430-4959(-)
MAACTYRLRWWSLLAIVVDICLEAKLASGLEEKLVWNDDATANITIGAILSIERARAAAPSAAQHAKLGYELFFDLLNTQNGGVDINGTKYHVNLHIIEDGETRAGAEEAVTTAMAERGLKLFLGPADADLFEVAGPLAHASGGLMIAPDCSNSSIFASHPRLFSMMPAGDKYLTSVSDKYGSSYNVVGRITYVDSAAQISHCFSDKVPEGFASWNINITSAVKEDSSELQKRLHWYFANTVQLLYVCVPRDVCEVVMEALIMQEINPSMLIMTTCLEDTDTEVIRRFGHKMNFVIGMTPWTADLRTASASTGLQMEDFVQMYRQRGSFDPNYVAAAAFSAAAALITAVQAANTTDPDAVATQLAALDVQEILGGIKFDENNMNTLSINAVQYQLGAQPKLVLPASTRSELPFFPKPSWDVIECMAGPMRNSRQHCGLIPRMTSMQCVDCLDGSRSTINVLPSFGILDNVSAFFCDPCEPGSCIDQTSSRNDCVYCPRGRYTSEAAMTHCLDCPMGKFAAGIGSTECEDCSAGKYTNLQASTECRLCHEDDADVVMTSFEPGQSKCVQCPLGGHCFDNGTIVSRAGYYMLEVDDEAIPFEDRLRFCIHDQGQVCEADSHCMEGHEGLACGKCSEGYARGVMRGRCLECPSTMVALLYIFGNALHTFLYCLAISMSLRAVQMARANFVVAIVFKLVCYYSALMSAVTTTMTLEGKKALELLYLISAAEASEFTAVADSCVLKTFFAADLYKVYIVLGWLVLPCLLVGDALLCWIVAKAMYPCFRWSKWGDLLHVKRENFASFFFTHLIVLHTRIIHLLMVPFDCVEADPMDLEGGQRLVWDAEVVCGGPDYVFWRQVATLGVVFYGILLPLFLCWIVYSLRIAGRQWHPRAQKGFGILYVGYASDRWFYELVLLLRKMAFLVVPVSYKFVGTTLEFYTYGQAVTMSLMAFGFLAMHEFLRPFDNRQYYLLHRIERATLRAVVATLSLQILVWRTNDSVLFVEDWAKELRNQVVTIIIDLCHAWFWLLVLWAVFGSFVKRTQFYKRHLRSGLILRDRGLACSNLRRSSARQLFIDAVSELAMTHLSLFKVLNPQSFTTCLTVAMLDAVSFEKLSKSASFNLEEHRGMVRSQLALHHSKNAHHGRKGATFEAMEDSWAKCWIDHFYASCVSLRSDLFILFPELQAVGKLTKEANLMRQTITQLRTRSPAHAAEDEEDSDVDSPHFPSEQLAPKEAGVDFTFMKQETVYIVGKTSTFQHDDVYVAHGLSEQAEEEEEQDCEEHTIPREQARMTYARGYRQSLREVAFKEDHEEFVKRVNQKEVNIPEPLRRQAEVEILLNVVSDIEVEYNKASSEEEQLAAECRRLRRQLDEKIRAQAEQQGGASSGGDTRQGGTSPLAARKNSGEDGKLSLESLLEDMAKLEVSPHSWGGSVPASDLHSHELIQRQRSSLHRLGGGHGLQEGGSPPRQSHMLDPEPEGRRSTSKVLVHIYEEQEKIWQTSGFRHDEGADRSA